MSEEPLIVAVILNSNRRDDTLECLASLKQNTYGNWKAIVLENASKDGSLDAIRRDFPEVALVQLERNLGYAGNNNVGVGAALAAEADWVLVLNEDTVLAPDCLSKLAEAGESGPQIGIVGPLVLHYDEPTTIQSAGGRLGRFWESVHIGQNEEDHGQFTEAHSVDWISGCAIMVRRALIEQVGCLDDRYFYYWEETEWCMRAGRRGWRVVHVPQARIWHKGVKRSYCPQPQVTYYDTRNRLLTLAKHRAPTLVWLGTCLQLARTLASWTVRPKGRLVRQHRDAMWQGISDFRHQRWGKMPEV